MDKEQSAISSVFKKRSAELSRKINTDHLLLAKNESARAFEILSSQKLFSGLPAAELQSLAESSKFTRFNLGQYITVEGDEHIAQGFIVISGRLSMIKTSISGKELIVELLGPEDIFGLLEPLSKENLPSQLSVRAQSKAELLWIAASRFTSILDAHPLIYREVVGYLLHSLQASYKISRGLAHDKVEVRIATLLLSLALRFSRSLPTYQNNTIDITRQQIADLTGTTPETAIRVTRSMHKEGLIDIKDPGVVRLINLPALHSLSEEE